jgi:hypothetical protein
MYDFRAISPAAVGSAVLRSSTGGCRNGLRRIPAVPRGVPGSVPSSAVNRFALIRAALTISRSSANWADNSRRPTSDHQTVQALSTGAQLHLDALILSLFEFV